MKKFFYLLFLALFCVNFVNAQEELPKSSGSLFISYENVPKRIYIGEVFPVTLKAIITSANYDEINTRILDNNFIVLNKNILWTKTNNPQVLNTTIYLKAKKKTDKISGFNFDLYKDDAIIETVKLGSVEVESIKLNADSKFSNVIGKNFTVINSFASRFDENSIIITTNFEADNSNLEDFNVSNVEKNRIIVLDDSNFGHQKIQYSAVLPNHAREFEFTYFNTEKNKFELIKIPLVLKSDDISTHTDINPKENIFNLYKNVALLLLAGLLIVLFVVKRYKFAIIFAIIILLFLAYNNHPFNDIKISENTNVHILPNEKLTILYKTESVTDAEKLDEKNGFIKVLLPNEKIGWVKKESVVKN